MACSQVSLGAQIAWTKVHTTDDLNSFLRYWSSERRKSVFSSLIPVIFRLSKKPNANRRSLDVVEQVFGQKKTANDDLLVPIILPLNLGMRRKISDHTSVAGMSGDLGLGEIAA